MTATVVNEGVLPQDLKHDDKIILEEGVATIDHTFQTPTGDWALEVSMGPILDVIVVKADQKIRRV